jgi:ribokinase
MAKKSPDIVILGHHGIGAHTVRVHHIPAPGETVTAWNSKIIKDGGKGSHQAIVINRLGGNAAFIGKIASDERSKIAKQWLIDENVNIKHLLISTNEFPYGGITMIDDEGVNAIVSVPGARKTLTFEEVKGSIEDFRDAKIFITGFEIPTRTALEGAKLAKQLGMYTILNPAPLPEEPIGDLEFIDAMIPNEIEARYLAGLNSNEDISPRDLAVVLRKKYKVDLVIITLGNMGSYAFNGRNSFRIHPVKIDPVNSVGAGDAFIGGLAYSLVKGKTIEEALELANYVSAFSVAKEGSIESFPHLTELEEFIMSHGEKV